MYEQASANETWAEFKEMAYMHDIHLFVME